MCNSGRERGGSYNNRLSQPQNYCTCSKRISLKANLYRQGKAPQPRLQPRKREALYARRMEFKEQLSLQFDHQDSLLQSSEKFHQKHSDFLKRSFFTHTQKKLRGNETRRQVRLGFKIAYRAQQRKSGEIGPVHLYARANGLLLIRRISDYKHAHSFDWKPSMRQGVGLGYMFHCFARCSLLPLSEKGLGPKHVFPNSCKHSAWLLAEHMRYAAHHPCT